MTLSASIAEHAVFAKLRDALRAGGAVADVNFARDNDIDPADVATFRAASARYRLAIIMRCPKEGAVGFHGLVPPKRWADGHDSRGGVVKSGASGLGVHPEARNLFVSDYDLMSLWQRDGADGAWRKLFASALVAGQERGAWAPEAMAMVRLLNRSLVSKLQHGAQDDFTPPAGKPHPGVKADTRFAAFVEGEATPLRGMAACAAFYARHGLHWPYDEAGGFTRAMRPG